MSVKNQTNYQAVGEFHLTFGHPKPDSLQTDILQNDPKLAQFRLSLIEEELRELKEAVEENDTTEVIDALADILYVVYGMGQAFGINLDESFNDPDMDNAVEGLYPEFLGQDIPEKLERDAIEKNHKLALYRTELISKTFDNLKAAVSEKNLGYVSLELNRIICLCYGMSKTFGIDIDRAFCLVHDSNMSKLCRNETEAKETIEHYKTLPGFENVKVGYRLASDNSSYVVYNVETGKILKSKYFHLPDFTTLYSA